MKFERCEVGRIRDGKNVPVICPELETDIAQISLFLGGAEKWAALFAAAPDMLDALKALQKLLNSGSTEKQRQETLTLIEKAIKKAGGIL